MITTKERSKLKSISMNMQDGVIVGKDGLTDNVVTSVEKLLEAKEIVKIKVLNNSDITPRELCGKICEALRAEPVLVIGNKAVIYRRRQSDDKPHLLD